MADSRSPHPQPLVFRNAWLDARLKAREASLTDGAERGWVHTVLLAWQRHYLPRLTKRPTDLKFLKRNASLLQPSRPPNKRAR